MHLNAVGRVRLLKYRVAAGCRNITRGTFRPRIDVADHDRSAGCSKRKRGSAAYPRCARDQDGPPFKIDLEPFHMNLQKWSMNLRGSVMSDIGSSL